MTAPTDRSLRFGLGTRPPGFDPHRWWNSVTYCATVSVLEQLVTLHPETGALETPLLTHLPQPTHDASRYTFQLKPGVRFHDGSKLGAKDVKFSLERLCSPTLRGEPGALFQALPIVGMDDYVNERAREIAGIRVRGAHELSIDLEHPDASFLTTLAYPAAAVVPQRLVEADPQGFNSMPTGTGPLRFAQSQRNALVLERNHDYHGRCNSNIEAVVWRFDLDQAESIERILAGSQDMLYEPLSPQHASEIAGSRNGIAHVTREDNCYSLTLNVRHTLLANIDARRAIAMAIDKQRLSRMLGGFAEPAFGGLFSPLSRYFTKELAPAHDPRAARALIRSLARGEDIELELVINDEFPEPEIAEALASDLEAIGVRLRVVLLSYNDKATAMAERSAELSLCDWHLATPSGSFLVDPGFTSRAIDNGCCNYSRWTSAEVDELAQRAHRASPAEAETLYRRVDEIVVRDEIVWVPLAYTSRTDFVSNRVHGFRPARYPSPLVRFFHQYALAETEAEHDKGGARD